VNFTLERAFFKDYSHPFKRFLTKSYRKRQLKALKIWGIKKEAKK
jgi:hypothetical protein